MILSGRSNYLDMKDPGAIGEGWDGFRVGSEFCSQLVPSPDDIRSLPAREEPGAFTLVTPVAGPHEVADVLEAVKTAASMGWGEVVVNDWGVLRGSAGIKGIAITAGRLLMRFKRGPGAMNHRDDLDPRSRQYFAWGPLYDSPFLAFLRSAGVERVELDAPRHWMPVPLTGAFRFSFHRDTRLVSVSAACPWLYDESRGAWRPFTECGRVCRTHNDIIMTAPALKTPLFLRGRAMLEKVDMDLQALQLPEAVDRIICDSAVSRFP